MPPVHSTEALVVGGADSGDADRVVHLLTADGRLVAFAPQAKRSRRRFGGALEPFTTVVVQYTESRKRGALPTLSEAVVRRARLPLRRSLESIALASYWAELGFRIAPEGQSSGVAALVEHAWDILVEAPPTRRLCRAVELKLLAELGYQPEFGRCVACGAELDPPYVDFARGGLFCDDHRAGAPEIGPKTMRWLASVLASPGLDPDGGVDSEWAEKAATKLTGPVRAFWANLLDRPLKAGPLLAEVGL